MPVALLRMTNEYDDLGTVQRLIDAMFDMTIMSDHRPGYVSRVPALLGKAEKRSTASNESKQVQAWENSQ